MPLLIPDAVRAAAIAHRYPLLFATVSGAHLYGFPSPDSDWDLRGAHILPARDVVGLLPTEETITITQDDELELHLVTHDIHKFFKLLLRPNGYVLEQLLSPLIVLTTPEHDEVKALVPQLLTRHHAHHYLGFADSQWRLFSKEEPPRVKPLLYTFRVLLTGIHLMRTGQIEANLLHLRDLYPVPFLSDWIERKLNGAEQETLPPTLIPGLENEFISLRERLVAESLATALPDRASALPALNDLLIRIRLASL